MTSPPLRVVKLGGSLFDWPGWVAPFRRWLAAQPPAVNVLVVGGGAIVDRLRALDRVQAMSAETAHWLAVRAMSLTAAIAAELVSEATLVDSLEQLHLSATSVPQILDVERFLRDEQGAAGALPCNWDVTSDSIAARVATALHAGELVLLKSALPAGPATREAIAQCEYVDAYFARAARRLPVRFVNLRDAGFAEVAFDGEQAGC
ncbi:MAG: hypothetical protein WD063_18895 [Pirellulales bacterium]